MIIDVARLPEEGDRFEGEESPAIFEMEGEKDVRFDGPVHYDLAAQLVSSELIVSGSLKVSMGLRCRRCAEFFSSEITEPSFNCVREVTDEMESADLTADIREAMLLVFPTYPLCSEDCKGLCARCGGNLNRNECSCGPHADFRWGGLENLKITGR